MADISLHHIEYGLCVDFLTGESLVDTDDERFRQKIASFLVFEKGFHRSEIIARQKIETLFNRQFVVSTIDFIIQLKGRELTVIRYGPGSIVTRERPAIAAARVYNPQYQIPLAVVTNGIDAELLDTLSGQVLAYGLSAIPSRNMSLDLVNSLNFISFPASKREKELRILNVYDVDMCCVGGACTLPKAPEG